MFTAQPILSKRLADTGYPGTLSEREIYENCSEKKSEENNPDIVTLFDLRPPRKPREWIALHDVTYLRSPRYSSERASATMPQVYISAGVAARYITCLDQEHRLVRYLRSHNHDKTSDSAIGARDLLVASLPAAPAIDPEKSRTNSGVRSSRPRAALGILFRLQQPALSD